MSVYAMAKNAEPGADPKSYLVALKDYIPAEALAIYIFAVGFLAPAAEATKLDIAAVKVFCVAVGMVATAAIALATFKADTVSGNGLLGKRISEKGRRRLAVIAVGWSSLIAYVLATLEPLGVLLATVDVSRFLAVLAALWALILPVLARALGVRAQKA